MLNNRGFNEEIESAKKALESFKIELEQVKQKNTSYYYNPTPLDDSWFEKYCSDRVVGVLINTQAFTGDALTDYLKIEKQFIQFVWNNAELRDRLDPSQWCELLDLDPQLPEQISRSYKLKFWSHNNILAVANSSHAACLNIINNTEISHHILLAGDLYDLAMHHYNADSRLADFNNGITVAIANDSVLKQRKDAITMIRNGRLLHNKFNLFLAPNENIEPINEFYVLGKYYLHVIGDEKAIEYFSQGIAYKDNEIHFESIKELIKIGYEEHFEMCLRHIASLRNSENQKIIDEIKIIDTLIQTYRIKLPMKKAIRDFFKLIYGTPTHIPNLAVINFLISTPLLVGEDLFNSLMLIHPFPTELILDIWAEEDLRDRLGDSHWVKLCKENDKVLKTVIASTQIKFLSSEDLYNLALIDMDTAKNILLSGEMSEKISVTQLRNLIEKYGDTILNADNYNTRYKLNVIKILSRPDIDTLQLKAGQNQEPITNQYIIGKDHLSENNISMARYSFMAAVGDASCDMNGRLSCMEELAKIGDENDMKACLRKLSDIKNVYGDTDEIDAIKKLLEQRKIDVINKRIIAGLDNFKSDIYILTIILDSAPEFKGDILLGYLKENIWLIDICYERYSTRLTPAQWIELAPLDAGLPKKFVKNLAWKFSDILALLESQPLLVIDLLNDASVRHTWLALTSQHFYEVMNVLNKHEDYDEEIIVAILSEFPLLLDKYLAGRALLPIKTAVDDINLIDSEEMALAIWDSEYQEQLTPQIWCELAEKYHGLAIKISLKPDNVVDRVKPSKNSWTTRHFLIIATLDPTACINILNSAYKSWYFTAIDIFALFELQNKLENLVICFNKYSNRYADSLSDPEAELFNKMNKRLLDLTSNPEYDLEAKARVKQEEEEKLNNEEIQRQADIAKQKHEARVKLLTEGLVGHAATGAAALDIAIIHKGKWREIADQIINYNDAAKANKNYTVDLSPEATVELTSNLKLQEIIRITHNNFYQHLEQNTIILAVKSFWAGSDNTEKKSINTKLTAAIKSGITLNYSKTTTPLCITLQIETAHDMNAWQNKML